MSKSRKTMLSQFNIQEDGLQKLIDDLCTKNEDDLNLAIIKKALYGTYSDFGSSADMPVTLLAMHLNSAGYPDMAKNAEQGKYDHPFGAKLSATSGQPDTNYQAQVQSFANSMGFIRNWIKSDIEKKNSEDKPEKETPRPGN